MLLRDLPPLLREEPGFASVLGRSSAVLAVPEPARALTIAGLATLSARRPIVVAVPTTGDADRLANDLRAYLGADAVDTFPAWETLPVRAGVAVGRDDGPPPAHDVAAARSRPGAPRPRGAGAGARAAARPPRRGRRARGGRARRAARPRRAGRARSSARATAGRRSSSTAASWPCAARSSTCTRPPPTGRCASTCGATRSTGSPSSRSPTSAPPTTSPGSRCSAAASCCPPTRCGSGPSG